MEGKLARPSVGGHITAMPLISVRNLCTWFPVLGGVLRRPKGEIKAVDGVSFDCQPGKTVGLVGESGSGKTTVGRTLLKLTPSTAGQVFYEGRDILRLSEAAFRPLRKDLQIIFRIRLVRSIPE